MKTFLLVALLAISIFYYHGPGTPASTNRVAIAPPPNRVLAREIVGAPAPSYQDRWKTGPNAFSDLKTGPDAQVHFEPFLPDEQANWNPAPGYTIVSGARMRR